MTTQVAPVQTPIETVTPLRPSEAMRLGRVLYPQSADWWSAQKRDGSWGVCASGAAMVGFGWNPADRDGQDRFMEAVMAHCPTSAVCPTGCSLGGRKVFGLIWHLNDLHGWPTERIADWLQGIGL